MSSLFQTGSFALLLATAILLPALVAVPAMAAGRSASIEQAPSSWESYGTGLRPPQERLDAGTPIEPHVGMRLSSSPKLKSNMSDYHVQ